MQEEEVGKNKILNIKEENYKKVIITKNGKFTVYSLFFDCNRFSTLNSLSKEDELELEKESKLSKMVDFCIKICFPKKGKIYLEKYYRNITFTLQKTKKY